jgi:hypothetical protein
MSFSDCTPTVKRSRMLSAITQGIQHLLLETGSEYSLRPYLTNTACAGAVTLDPSDYLAFADQLPNVKVVIWNKGPVEGLSAREVATIKARQGRTFLCGDGLVGSLDDLQSLSDFGLEWIGWNVEGGSTGINWFSGQADDVITGDLGTNIEGRLIYYYVNLVKINDTQNVFPILHFRSDGRRSMGGSNTYSISAADAIFAVRSTKNNTRTVLLGISPYVIANQQTRRTLVANIVNWQPSEDGQAPSQESAGSGLFGVLLLAYQVVVPPALLPGCPRTGSRRHRLEGSARQSAIPRPAPPQSDATC